jgi:type I restriction enzyme M protein
MNLKSSVNAREHFAKGKRQNTLAKKNIASIVETYKYRKEAERYSRKVYIYEIKKNGYNLNISRYVSTAEDEVQIDLTEVHKKLEDIEKAIKLKTEEHNAFLIELGLKKI